VINFPKIESIGDSHNFGKFVDSRSGTWVHKPRNIFWEWMLLSKESPLRSGSDAVSDAFASLPCLGFSNVTDTFDSGSVEKVTRYSPGLEDCADPAFLQRIGGTILKELREKRRHYFNFGLVV